MSLSAINGELWQARGDMFATEPLTSRTNGHAILRLGDTTPERMAIEINGRLLDAWVVTNGRYPSSVASALDDARNAYSATRQRVFDGPPPPDLVESVRVLLEACRTDGTLPSEETLLRLVDDQRKALAGYDATPVWKALEVEWSAYITRVLMTLIPGLEEQEAELLPTDARFGVLMELGYFQKPSAEPDQEAGDASDPQEAAVVQSEVPPDEAHSTGDAPELSSPASTE